MLFSDFPSSRYSFVYDIGWGNRVTPPDIEETRLTARDGLMMSSMQLLGFDSKSAYSLAHGAVDKGGGWLLVW